MCNNVSFKFHFNKMTKDTHNYKQSQGYVKTGLQYKFK